MTPRTSGDKARSNVGDCSRRQINRSEAPPRWTRRLERAMGTVRSVGIEDGQHVDSTRLVYLPAYLAYLDFRPPAKRMRGAWWK